MTEALRTEEEIFSVLDKVQKKCMLAYMMDFNRREKLKEIRKLVSKINDSIEKDILKRSAPSTRADDITKFKPSFIKIDVDTRPPEELKLTVFLSISYAFGVVVGPPGYNTYNASVEGDLELKENLQEITADLSRCRRSGSISKETAMNDVKYFLAEIYKDFGKEIHTIVGNQKSFLRNIEMYEKMSEEINILIQGIRVSDYTPTKSDFDVLELLKKCDGKLARLEKALYILREEVIYYKSFDYDYQKKLKWQEDHNYSEDTSWIQWSARFIAWILHKKVY